MKLITCPNPLLNQISRVVEDNELDGVRSLLDQLLDIMYAGQGVGLAGPQVGDLRRFVLVDPSNGDDVRSLRFMVNPIIEHRSNYKDDGYEGCLSLPGRRVKVKRHASITVSYTDAMSKTRVTVDLSGFEARIVQHEIDHLDGITLLERA